MPRNVAQKLIADQKLRPAMQPSVELEENFEFGKDAEVKVELEVLPEIAAPSIEGLKLERLTVPVDDAAVDAQLNACPLREVADAILVDMHAEATSEAQAHSHQKLPVACITHSTAASSGRPTRPPTSRPKTTMRTALATRSRQ